MEEIYDWLSDAEKQADSIAVNEDDISSVKEEYGRHRVCMIFIRSVYVLQIYLSLTTA